MQKNTKQDIIRLVKAEDVEFIRLQFTDIFGTLRNVAVTTSQLEKVLDNKYSFDGTAIPGFVQAEEADFYLYPDLDTFAIFPWRPQQGKVARFLCDIYSLDRIPFEGDSRYILKKVIHEAEKMGFTFQAGPECEFFLFDLDEDGNVSKNFTKEIGGYFDIGPLDSGENARREIVLTLEELGFEIEASHHEAAPAQHEIDFKYTDGLVSADNIVTFKMAVRTIARRHGMHAAFMPKPRSGMNGSGMHINMSLKKNEKNIFENKNDVLGLSEEAYYFIQGLIKHVKAMTAITNPIVNSYKRLIPGYEAPSYIGWSAKTRSSLIRIPAQRGEATRVELRSPDPSCNPYLALALCLAAGLDGIRSRCLPPAAVDKKISSMTEEEQQLLSIERLPLSLESAITELENSTFIKQVLGDYITRKFIEAKKKEWEEYRTQVTDWELEQYIDKF